jgi:hypothetical protein
MQPKQPRLPGGDTRLPLGNRVETSASVPRSVCQRLVGSSIAVATRLWTRSLATAAVLACFADGFGCSNLIGADEITLVRGGAGGGAGTADASGGAAGKPRTCARQSDCVTLSEHACVADKCVDLRNDRTDSGSCKLVLGSEYLTASLEPFLFGVFTVIPSEAPETWPPTRNYEFAIREFSRRGGVPIQGELRYPVAVACDARDLDKSLDHLSSLGIASVIAPTTSAVALKQSFARLNGERPTMFFINPLASSSLFHSASNQGLIWSLLGDPLELVPAYLDLIPLVELNLHATSHLDRPMRLMLVHDDDPVMTDIANAVDAEIAGSAANYRRFALKSPDADGYRSYLDAQEEAAAFRPDAVVAIAGDTFIEFLMRPLEINWPSFAGETRPPFYVLSPHHSAEPKLLQLLEERPDIAGRLAGINAAGASEPQLYEKYLRALTAEYPDDRNLEGSENFYDAAYFLLYAAAAAAGPEPLTMGEAMQRLIRGDSYDVGSSNIDAVLELLRDPDASISLNGTLGPPKFDARTGARRAPGSIWCVASTASGFEYHYDVWRDGDDGQVRPFDCFTFP